MLLVLMMLLTIYRCGLIGAFLFLRLTLLSRGPLPSVISIAIRSPFSSPFAQLLTVRLCCMPTLSKPIRGRRLIELSQTRGHCVVINGGGRTGEAHSGISTFAAYELAYGELSCDGYGYLGS